MAGNFPSSKICIFTARACTIKLFMVVINIRLLKAVVLATHIHGQKDSCFVWRNITDNISWYCQFHQYFTSSFFVRKFFAPLLCAYNLSV